MIAPYLIAIGVGVAACLAVYQGIKTKAYHEGANFERARVLAQEARTDVKITKAETAHRRRTAAKPSGVLDRWSID